MTPIKSRKLHGINIADFFKEYLSTELYHSFDCYDIDKKIDELKNKFIKKNINAFDNDIINRWCSTYKEFNQTLRKIRYKTPSLHMSNPTNAKEEYDKKYHGHVNNIDRILKDLFEFFLSGTTVTKKINEIDNIEELENSLEEIKKILQIISVQKSV